MRYWAIDLDDYNRDPEWHEWHQIESGWPGMGPEDAAQEFIIHEGDPYGRFGSRNTKRQSMQVMVYDSEGNETHLVNVYPNPKPGYRFDVLHPVDAAYEHQIKLEDTPKPNGLQIPE